MTRLTLRLPEALATALQERCERLSLSMNQEIIRAVDEHLRAQMARERSDSKKTAA